MTRHHVPRGAACESRPPRQEGGKVFGSGSRTGVAILVAVKRKDVDGPCKLHYHGVAEYLTREEKLAGLDPANLTSVPWTRLTPHESGDWVNQRSDSFGGFPRLGSKESTGVQPPHFSTYSLGLATGRDAWCYNFAEGVVSESMTRMIAAYNEQVRRAAGVENKLDNDPTQISWNRELIRDATRGIQHEFKPESVRTSAYRPFCKINSYFDRPLNAMIYRLASIFPTPAHTNLGISIMAPRPGTNFAVVATNELPDLNMFVYPAQFFPRWTYEKASTGEQDSLMASTAHVDEWGYRRVDNITDGILALYQAKFGPKVAKDDVFSYVYGVLHSEQYRTTFAADLKRMLPRIPLAASTSDFEAFVEAGRKLADLHVNYETVEPYPLAEQTPFVTDPWQTYRVEKMRWADKTTKKSIVYNSHITLGDIPAEANRYMLGSRSALEWLIDRYQVKTDKDSGIVNDPNDWCREHGNPRYIVDLIKRITRVSVETMRIVDSLPELPL